MGNSRGFIVWLWGAVPKQCIGSETMMFKSVDFGASLQLKEPGVS